MFGRLVGLSICVIYLFQSMVVAHPSIEKENKCLNYCSNEGVCVIHEDEPQCYCLPEWQGERCQALRDEPIFDSVDEEPLERAMIRSPECLLAPAGMCVNGLCKFENSSYSCQCPPTHIGKRCQDPSPCVGYCFNGGLCQIDVNTDPKCICNGTGFAGPQCRRPDTTTTLAPKHTTTDARCSALVDMCKPGVCVIVNGRPQCQCPPGTQGAFCEAIQSGTLPPGQTILPTINPSPNPNPTANPNPNPNPDAISCTKRPCQNNRPCYNNGNTYYCYCGTQYTGVNCENLLG